MSAATIANQSPPALDAAQSSPGTGATSPFNIPRAGWATIAKRTIGGIVSDKISLAAAACGFYGTLALFPAISSLISIYGLAFDPQTVEPQLEVMRSLLPKSAYDLISESVHTLVAQPHSSLTVGLLISITIALWSASASTRSILASLNIAYNQPETRSFLRFQATAVGMTLVTILSAVLAIALLVALPVLLDFLPAHLGVSAPSWSIYVALKLGGPILMLMFVLIAISLLYRFGPARPEKAEWRWIMPGSLAATFIWLLVSILFSFYVSHVASYSKTYGPLGAVVGIMMWLYVSAFVVLLGAEFGATMEQLVKGDKKPDQQWN